MADVSLLVKLSIYHCQFFLSPSIRRLLGASDCCWTSIQRCLFYVSKLAFQKESLIVVCRIRGVQQCEFLVARFMSSPQSRAKVSK